mmetsp:Transcript_6592/g.18451  ORF Transcript_6592/g.18451 Transcript_6592/m.18451 type:complete len:210 (+) Transcript_6592:1109-1738(+)
MALPIPQRHAGSVADVQPVRGQFAPQVVFGIPIEAFRNVVELPQGHVRHGASGATGNGQIPMVQSDILDASTILGMPHDGTRQRIVINIVPRWTANVVRPVRCRPGDVGHDVRYRHMANRSGCVTAAALAEANQERVARVASDQVPCRDVFDQGPVHRFNGQERSNGIVNGHVFNANVLKGNLAGSAQFNGTGATADPAVANADVVDAE